MEKIPSTISSESRISTKMDDIVVNEQQFKEKFKKNFMNYAGIFIGVFLLFAVVVIVTTDINITTFDEMAALGLDFFLLLFCSYSMYINCCDSGTRMGLASKLYTDAVEVFETHKKQVIENGQSDLPKFCHHYVSTELKNSRMEILAVVGISYDDYVEKYMSVDVDEIEKNEELSTIQKEAIIKANSIKPIKLTSEMIMQRGRGSRRRSPLGIKPHTVKIITFGFKFVTTFVVSLIMSMIVLDIVVDPTWIMFTSCILKLLAVVMNGFMGYKFGFENIVVDTVNYMNDQVDLMRQAIDFFNTCDNK